jgi:hypothetical protein
MFPINKNEITVMSPEEIQIRNQQWRNTSAPHVLLEWVEKDHTDNPYTVSQKDAYKFGEILNKIQILQMHGKTICLFIGRTPFEELPSDRREAKENEVWISADPALISPEGFPEDSEGPMTLTKYKNLSLNPDLIHLWLNFNEQKDLEQIQGLFDKVVIDQSTTKMFENNFTQRFSILLRTPESELIFENPSLPCLNTLGRELTFTFQPELNSLETTFAYLKSVRKENDLQWLREQATALFKEHLQSIYNKVEEYKNTNYPYTTNYSSWDNTDHYFIVGHPK